MDLWALAERFGLPVAMLMFAVWLLYTDRVVSGRRYREACAQRDRLLKLALSSQRKAWQLADVGDALVSATSEESRARDDSGD